MSLEGLERWLGSKGHLLPLQRICICFLVLILGDSQLPVTPASGLLVTTGSVLLCTYTHKDSHMYISKNKIIFKNDIRIHEKSSIASLKVFAFSLKILVSFFK